MFVFVPSLNLLSDPRHVWPMYGHPVSRPVVRRSVIRQRNKKGRLALAKRPRTCPARRRLLAGGLRRCFSLLDARAPEDPFRCVVPLVARVFEDLVVPQRDWEGHGEGA